MKFTRFKSIHNISMRQHSNLDSCHGVSILLCIYFQLQTRNETPSPLCQNINNCTIKCNKKRTNYFLPTWNTGTTQGYTKQINERGVREYNTYCPVTMATTLTQQRTEATSQPTQCPDITKFTHKCSGFQCRTGTCNLNFAGVIFTKLVILHQCR